MQGGPGNNAAEAYCASCSRSFPLDVSHCPHDGAKLVRFEGAADPMLGKILDGRFEIRAPLGEGGMGTVYRGWQLSVDREVAIKVVHPSIASHREAAKRFLREARLATRLSAPGIVNVFDFGQADGVLYIVMELLRGRSLDAVRVAAGVLPPRRVIHFAEQLCDALEAAHVQGIVHRDLKPGNVIILDDPPGRDLLKVLDFGLAKSISADATEGITSTNAMMGTPLYMAPEQIESAAIDGRTDLYALACIMHELLTGVPPFVDATLSALLAKQLHEPPPAMPPWVPPALAAVIARMLAKRPDERFASCAEVRAALGQVRASLGTPAAGVPILPQAHAPLAAGTPAPPMPTPMPTPLPASADEDADVLTLMPLPAPAVVAASADPRPSASFGAMPPARRAGLIAAVAAAIIAVGLAALVATGAFEPRKRPDPPPPPAPAAGALVAPDAPR